MSARRRLWLALPIALAACGDAEDATGPGIPNPGECPGGTCEVRGVDLVLGDVAFVDPPPDGPFGYPVAAPGDTLRVAWSVTNRGDRMSAPTRLVLSYTAGSFNPHEVDVPLAEIAPGDTLRDTTAVVILPPRSVVLWSAAETDSVVIQARLEDREGDPFFRNDSSALPPFTFAVPLLEGEIFLLTGASDSSGFTILALGDTLLWERRIRNASVLAAMPDTGVIFCTWWGNGGSGCEGGQFEFPALPAIAPGDSLVDTVAFVVQFDMLPWPEYAGWEGLDAAGAWVCLPHDPEVTLWWDSCFAWGRFVVRAAFPEMCDSGSIVPGETHVDAEVEDCWIGGPARDVWSFTAEAGAVYEVTAPGSSITIHRGDGSELRAGYGALGVLTTESGPHFITVTSGGYTLTLNRRL